MKLAYIGFGDFGKQIQHFVETPEQSAERLVFDDFLHSQNTALPFIDYQKDLYKDFFFYLGLGYHHLTKRNSILNELLKKGRNLPSYVHPSVFLSPTSIVKHACFIYPCCNIDAGVVIENGAILNNSVTVSHNSRIGTCSYISPGVVISGNVTMGENVFIGAGTMLINNISIGDNCIIGAGTVITRSLPPNSSAIGNPMRVLNHPLKLK